MITPDEKFDTYPVVDCNGNIVWKKKVPYRELHSNIREIVKELPIYSKSTKARTSK